MAVGGDGMDATAGPPTSIQVAGIGEAMAAVKATRHPAVTRRVVAATLQKIPGINR
jgi:hypothetical protein